MVQGWLRERQYTTPYHWRQKPSDEHEYQLRTRIVLELTGLSDTARSNARLLDIVTLLAVIEHVPDADERRVIAEARRALRPAGRLVVSTNSDRSACELKHHRHYWLERFRSLFDGSSSVRLEGLIPYFPTLRFWMALPVVWRCLRSRIRRCTPEIAHVIIGAGSRT